MGASGQLTLKGSAGFHFPHYDRCTALCPEGADPYVWHCPYTLAPVTSPWVQPTRSTHKRLRARKEKTENISCANVSLLHLHVTDSHCLSIAADPVRQPPLP